MKSIFTLFSLFLLFICVHAQSPQLMSYQAVVRNAANTLVINSAVGMRISILQGSASGTSVYTEKQVPISNANGLVTLQIGGGTLVSGNFSTINWGANTYFIKTETDPAGGTNYTITGTTQLLSVPYALSAKSAESFTGTAGGDLTGNYPNPTIGNAVVTGAKIANATIPLAKLSASGTPSATTFLRGDGAWAVPPIGPQNAVFIPYVPGNTFTVTDVTKTYFALNCNGAAGGGATTTISLLHPNQYVAGTVLGFSVHAYSTVVGPMVLTSAVAGVKFTGAFNSNKLSITSPSNYSLPTPNNIFIKLMSDGVDTWYRIGM